MLKKYLLVFFVFLTAVCSARAEMTAVSQRVLYERLLSLASSYETRVGVSVIDLATGLQVNHNATCEFPTASVGKVPVILAIGMQEVEGRTVSVRRLGETRTETMALDAALAAFGFEALPPG